MKTVNQLIDIFQASGIKTEKIKKLTAKLHDLKMISGGLARIENTDDILRILATEKAKFSEKNKNIEYRKN